MTESFISNSVTPIIWWYVSLLNYISYDSKLRVSICNDERCLKPWFKFWSPWLSIFLQLQAGKMSNYYSTHPLKLRARLCKKERELRFWLRYLSPIEVIPKHLWVDKILYSSTEYIYCLKLILRLRKEERALKPWLRWRIPSSLILSHLFIDKLDFNICTDFWKVIVRICKEERYLKLWPRLLSPLSVIFELL